MIDFRELIPGKKLPDIKAAVSLSYQLLNKAEEQAVIAEKFQKQLQQLVQQTQQTGDTTLLEERVRKAITYFIKSLAEDILRPLRQHTDLLQHATKIRKYVTDVLAIESFLHQQLQKIMQASYGDVVFYKDATLANEYTVVINQPAIHKRSKKQAPVKGSSNAESLVLFKEGKSISEIAAMRQLTESTVGGHLSSFVRTGELNVLELLSQETINTILPIVKEVSGNAVSPIKEILGDDFSYTDIRIVLNHWHWMQLKKVNA
jgi:uncharacterized protein YpbB